MHPDFIIIGGPRSGTTFIYDCLKQHPDVFLRNSKRPEPHFFMLPSRYNKGIDWYYEQVFSEYKGESLSGEASTTMMYGMESIQRILEHNPKTKIICSLRNPIDRMVSEYLKSVQTNWEDLSFEEAVQAEPKRIEEAEEEYHRIFEPGSYKKRGLYWKHLSKWIEAFGPDQVQLLLFEDLKQKPQATMDLISDFLNISRHDFNWEQADTNATERRPVEISEEFIRNLKDFYREDVQALEKFLGKDLATWYR